jgi:Tfp pilus assembly protein PilF
MTPQQKRALPLYILLTLIVFATVFIVSRYGTHAMSEKQYSGPSQEMIELVIKEAEDYMQRGRYSNAAGVLRRLLVDEPKHKQSLLMLSVCYFALNRLDTAERCCRKLQERYPADARILNNLGEVLIRRKNFKEGLFYLNRAAYFAPAMPLIQFNLSLAHSFCGNFELAQKHRDYGNLLVQCGTFYSQPYMISNALPDSQGDEK